MGNNIEPSFVVSVLMSLGTIYVVWRKANSAKNSFVEDVITAIKAEEAKTSKGEARTVTFPPTPVELEEYRRDKAAIEARFQSNELRFQRLESKMETDKQQIIDAGEERAVALHERINAVMSTASEIKGELKQINLRIK